MSKEYDTPEKLIVDIQQGRTEAFAHVFREYYAPLLNYAGRILRDTELANDLVQETFCGFYEHRHKLNISVSLKAYLYKSVYNHCLDAIKHKKVETNYVNQTVIDFYFSKIIQTPEAELTLLNEEIKVAVWEAINKLPGRCREVFVLSKIEELSNKQIAEQLDISIKTVEAQMTTAFERLRKELGWLLCIIFITDL